MTVYLVGTGPGAADLLTVRAAKLLGAAEHVVYDRPSMAEIVALAPAAAHKHIVGKSRGRPALSQDEVNAFLVELGRSGESVVRLKAGDPFVVSRGSEESLALAAAGIPFEVVPGISAAVAAPAYAGVPVMVRQLARTLTVVAANDDPAYPGPVDWRAVAAVGGTIVLLTGRAALREIVAELLAGGLPPDTPITAVSAATRDRQRTVRGTLADPPDARLPAPLTVVIGTVAGLDLAWHTESLGRTTREHS
ncbi:uroporphyrinogen-III C-methyltransferase [Amycolatopsis sp. MtRt-6]|uniref:uroporphyrinogen-III C-methyltransferase n=1 Tax=Amycolatopsis sp. MtRt-6 TaxID=2792782 RepID=UPI001A8D30D1|nr:uroporphyrinogen-III C-methyltransferase [Amycolatopsis sp. MtRt-6]